MGSKTIKIIAGEPSGDLHGANLMRDLKKIDGSISFIGAGGKLMQSQGLEGITDMEALAVVGFREVFEKIRELKEAFKLLAETLKQKNPDCLVLIDYPGFNLRMAKVAKEQNIPVFYYISPQIWAWGKDRIEKIKKYVDKMFVILPFEENFYAQYAVKAQFVGHPLLDIVKPQLNEEEAFGHFALNSQDILVGLMPGSRWKEVKTSMPVMAEACAIISKQVPNAQFGVLVAKNIDTEKTKSLLPAKGAKFKLIRDKHYDFMNICDLLLVNSGTATLEVAILEKPMVIIYKTSFFSWLLMKMLVKIPYFGLTNIVAGKKIVPEFFQFAATASAIAKESLHILANGNKIITMQDELSKTKAKLGEPGASERTAKAIMEEIIQ
jgi:lipid-A-disaccharide synthase